MWKILKEEEKIGYRSITSAMNIPWGVLVRTQSITTNLGDPIISEALVHVPHVHVCNNGYTKEEVPWFICGIKHT